MLRAGGWQVSLYPNGADNVPVNVDGVLFLSITDPFKASYEVELPGGGFILASCFRLRTQSSR